MGPLQITITTITITTCILTQVEMLELTEIANQLVMTMIAREVQESAGLEELAHSLEKKPTCLELARVMPTPPITTIISTTHRT